MAITYATGSVGRLFVETITKSRNFPVEISTEFWLVHTRTKKLRPIARQILPRRDQPTHMSSVGGLNSCEGLNLELMTMKLIYSTLEWMLYPEKWPCICRFFLESASVIELFTMLNCCLLDSRFYPEDGGSTFSEISVNSHQTAVYGIPELSFILGTLSWPVTLRTEGETAGGWGQSAPSALSQSVGPVSPLSCSSPVWSLPRIHCLQVWNTAFAVEFSPLSFLPVFLQVSVVSVNHNFCFQ